jgi:hypothetical protein
MSTREALIKIMLETDFVDYSDMLSMYNALVRIRVLAAKTLNPEDAKGCEE